LIAVEHTSVGRLDGKRCCSLMTSTGIARQAATAAARQGI